MVKSVPKKFVAVADRKRWISPKPTFHDAVPLTAADVQVCEPVAPATSSPLPWQLGPVGAPAPFAKPVPPPKSPVCAIIEVGAVVASSVAASAAHEHRRIMKESS